MQFDGFDWDEGNLAKCRKHGLSPREIEEILSGPITLILPDERHSGTETRSIAVGRTAMGRHAFVAFTIRERDGRTLLRPISARYMHAKEVRRYEQQVAHLRD